MRLECQGFLRWAVATNNWKRCVFPWILKRISCGKEVWTEGYVPGVLKTPFERRRRAVIIYPTENYGKQINMAEHIYRLFDHRQIQRHTFASSEAEQSMRKFQNLSQKDFGIDRWFLEWLEIVQTHVYYIWA